MVFFPRFPNKTLYASLLSHVRAARPAHLILLDLITGITFGEECVKLSLCSRKKKLTLSPGKFLFKMMMVMMMIIIIIIII
jgi:hypothetical protein